MVAEPNRSDLEAAHCWEPSDRVPGDAATTAFRRAARLAQARWREARGHPIGSQPMRAKPGAALRPVGSRIDLDHAVATGAAFVTPAALEAVRARLELVEPHQTTDRQRVWADLLWAPSLAVNLLAGVDTATVRRWWPDVPGEVVAVRFAHSPGRLDPELIGSLVDWHAAIELDLGDGTAGVLAVQTPYADVPKREVAKPQRLARYAEVAERSGAFRPGAANALDRSDLLVLWLQHLLALSLLRHPSGRWSWARLVVVHPGANAAQAGACHRYGSQLTGNKTFRVDTLERLLGTGPVRDRYLVRP